MALVKISELPEATPGSADIHPFVQDGNTRQGFLRVWGNRFADVTDPAFGADPTGVVPVGSSWANAFDSLVDGGRFRVPGGDYLAASSIVLSGKRGVTIDTDGQGSALNFVATAPLTDGLRIVDCPGLIFNGMRVRHSSPGADITNLVHITTTSTAQHVSISDLCVDPQAAGVGTKLAIGGDTGLDVAEYTLNNVYLGGVESSLAALRLGNGIAGNVTNIRAFGCYFGHALYGVLMDGATIQAYGCTAQHNSGSDFKVINPGSAQPIIVDGCRSEHSKRFFEYIQNGQITAPISLKNISIGLFTDVDEDVIWVAGIVNLTLDGWSVLAPAQFLITSPTIPGEPDVRAAVQVRNVMTHTQNPFPANANVDVEWAVPHRYINPSTLLITEAP